MFDRLKAKIRAHREAKRDRGAAPVDPSEPDRSSPVPARRPGLLVRIMLELLKKLLATSAGSIKGQIDMTELVKAIGTALAGSGIVGLLLTALIAVFTAIGTAIPAITSNFFVATALTWVVGFIIDLLRRMAAGQKPIPVQPGETVLTHGTFVPSDINTSAVRPVNATRFPDDLATGPAGVVR